MSRTIVVTGGATGIGRTATRRESLIQATLTKREGVSTDIAETIWFLASPGARHLTAQTLHLNGGALTTR